MTTLKEDITELATKFAAPISDAAPAGADASYDPAFETVKAELDKLTSVSGEQVNWRSVASDAAGLTQQVTKDVRLLAWMALARLQVDGVRGLAEGLSICSEVCSQHWDAMFPPLRRAKARANQVEWLFEQLDKGLPELKVTAADKEAAELAAEACQTLDALFAERLGDHYSARPRAAGILKDHAARVAVAAPAAKPASSAAPQASVPAVSVERSSAPIATEAAPAITGADSASAALRTTAKTIQVAARELRKQNAARAWPYTLARVATWLMVEDAPPAVDGNMTRLAAPDDRARLDALAAAEKWLDLVEAAEELASVNLFWLDPHRYTALALERLGPAYAQAQAAVAREVAGFVQRVPAVLSLQFDDGTPFADAACEAWLSELTAATSGGGGASHAQLDAEDEELRARFEVARQLVGSGKVDEGLSLAHALAERAPDARQRFKARLEVARLSVKGSKPTIARAILEGLAADCARHQLDDWEPALSAEVYALLLTSRRAAGGDSGEKPGHPDKPLLSDDEVLLRLCRLAPAQALRFTGL